MSTRFRSIQMTRSVIAASVPANRFQPPRDGALRRMSLVASQWSWRCVQVMSLVLLSAFVTVEPRAFAADVTWLGGASSAWSVGSNWLGGNVPASGDRLIFSDSFAVSRVSFNDFGASSTSQSVSISGSRAFDIDFNGAALDGSQGVFNLNTGASSANTIRNLSFTGTTRQTLESWGFQLVLQGVSGTAATRTAGNATVIWSGSNSYSGPISFERGAYSNDSSIASTITQSNTSSILGGSGTFGNIVSFAGTIMPGSLFSSRGVLSASGSIALGAFTTLRLQITSTGQGVGYDALVAGGTFDYGNAKLELDHLPLSPVPDGTMYQLFNAGSFVNNISSLTGLTRYGQGFTPPTFPGPDANGNWVSDVLYTGQTMKFFPSTGQLFVVPEPASSVGIAGLLVAGHALRRQLRARRRLRVRDI